MIAINEWLTVQNGEDVSPASPGTFDPVCRCICNMRELATNVHFDALDEAYLNACLILLDLGMQFDPSNPYVDSATQKGFSTFGGSLMLSLLSEVSTHALESVWYQKRLTHQRLRPEVTGVLTYNVIKGAASYPIHDEILDDSTGSLMDRVQTAITASGANTFLLSMVFRKGPPVHPAYGAGHAIVAVACVTVIKAWFD